MTERGSRIAQRFEQQVESVVDLISGLSEDDLAAPCRDPRGQTIGGVVAHLRDGTGQVMRWADTMAPGVTVTAVSQQPGQEHGNAHGQGHGDGHGHGHGHASGHGHDHEPGSGGAVVTLAGRDDTMASLTAAGSALAAAVRRLTDAQLDSCPPAAPDLTDGTARLHQVIDLVTDDLAGHRRHVEDALASRAAGQEVR